MKTTLPLIGSMIVALVVLLACTAQYPHMPEEPEEPAEPMTNIVGHAINYEQSGFSEPDNMGLSDSAVNFSNQTPERQMSISAAEDAIYKYGHISIEGGSWRRFELTGGTHRDDWVLDSASATITLHESNFTLQAGQSTDDNYVVIFSCTYLSDRKAWDCHNDQWQLHQLKARHRGLCTEGCAYEGQCYSEGEYLTENNNSICEDGTWIQLPSAPSEPENIS